MRVCIEQSKCFPFKQMYLLLKVKTREHLSIACRDEKLFRLLVMVLLDLDKWEGFDGSKYLQSFLAGQAT